MLFVPNFGSSALLTYDNWGANPSATPGTSIVPGATNAEGSWTQVASSGNINFNVYGFYIQVHSGATSAAAKNHVLDIGIDTAGGTSYSAIISDLVVGDSPALTAAGNREFFFPFYIPSGSSVAARVQGSSGTAGTIYVCIKFFGGLGSPEGIKVGSFSETIGTVNSTSRAVSFTPGNAADGSWTSLGTTTKNLWWWQLGYQIDNATITAEYTYIDVAYGDASNKHIMFREMHGGTTTETAGLALQTCLTPFGGYCPVPGGTTIYIRGRCNNAPDTGYNGNVIGIGG